jgi:23S rRNA (guanine745-N1)-methyltransferase
VNLLQPQDRRSAAAGDSKAAVDARATLWTSGVARHLLDAVVDHAGRCGLPPDAVVVDLGCGGGEVLAAVAAAIPVTGVGIDLSTAAIDMSARRHPELTWVVANADRRLPLLDGTAHLVLSVHGRRQPAECARILDPAGHLIVIVPAPDDLAELREQVQGQATSRDRAEAVVDEHRPHFTLVARATARARHTLDRDGLLALLRGTYRGERASAVTRVEALDRLDVTVASDVLVFQAGTGPA